MASKKQEPIGEREALDETLKKIHKQYGQGAIMLLGEATSMNVEAISTGSLSLDLATGIGGVPKGRIVEIYGPESSGKTTLALHIVAEAQKKGGRAAFIDAEHALDPAYAKALGVKTEELLVSQPDYGEQALEICDMLASSGAIDVIVIDSVAALVPRAELQGEMIESSVGVQARLMSKALRKIAGTLNKTNTCAIFINQLREKVGVMYGNPETTTGGRALKFYASMRLDVRRIESIKVGEQVIGNRTKVKISKNKVAPPFKKVEFDIMYGKGISISGDVLDSAVEVGVISKSGSWFSYAGERLGQGRENVKMLLEKDPEFMERIRQETLATIRQEEGDAAQPEPETMSSEHPFDAGIMVDDDGVVVE